jgi:hypothetical protein
MKLDLGDNAQARLAMLLREAEAAHGEYEVQIGHRDDDWPDWYAKFIIEQSSTG